MDQPAPDAPEGEQQQATSPGVGGLLYKVALAGVGGVMLAQEEIARVLRPRRAAPGEEGAETEAADPAAPEGATAEGAEASAPGPIPAATADRFDVAIERVLRTLKLPSRGDVDELGRAVAALEQRVASLAERRERG